MSSSALKPGAFVEYEIRGHQIVGVVKRATDGGFVVTDHGSFLTRIMQERELKVIEPPPTTTERHYKK